MADELDPSDLLKAAFSGDVNKVIALTNVSKSKRSLDKSSRAARLNVKDKNGKTALLLAVDKNHTRAIQTLVHAGADINLLGAGDQELLMTPLLYAVYKNKISCVREILKLGADINCGNSEWAFFDIAHRHKALLFNSYLSDLWSYTIKGRTALMYAAEHHRVKILKTLLKAGADVHVKSYSGMTALHFAALFSNESVYVSQCIKTLLNYGADWFAETSYGETPLMVMQNSYKSMYEYQNQNPSYEYAKMLIHVGTKVNKINLKRQTVSIHSVRNDDLISFLPILVEAVLYLKPAYAFVKMLIISGTDVNVSNLKGQTLLMHTVQNDDLVNFLPILVEAGAVIDQQDSSGMTALAHAASANSHKCIGWLVDHGASVNAKDNDGMTPLMHASRLLYYDNRYSYSLFFYTGEDITTLLFQHGADINLVDNLGQTALFHCVQTFLESDFGTYGIKACNIKFLLDKGAYLGSGTLSVGKLSRLIELGCEIDGLLNLQVGDEVDLKVPWDEFLPVIYKGKRKTLQFLIINKVMPSHSAQEGLRSRRRHDLYFATSVLEESLKSGDIGITKYLIATCYLCKIDLILSSSRSAVYYLNSNIPEIFTVVGKLCSQPWPLVKLCFVAVSTAFGASPGRQERVKNSQLPPSYRGCCCFRSPGPDCVSTSGTRYP